MQLSSDAAITGWHHGQFDKHSDLHRRHGGAGSNTRRHRTFQNRSGDIDAVFVGRVNAGLFDDGFISAMPLSTFPELRFKPAARVENACASGFAAIRQGLAAIGSGNAHNVLVVGVEKMTHRSGAEVAQALTRAGDAARGLKAKGHAVGASGVSMHAIAAMQLSGSAGTFQVPGASVGAVFNMGGSAVANHVFILRGEA